MNMAVDFAFAGLLLLAAFVLRVRIKLFQWLFLPASIIAGFIGLLFGPNGCGWLPLSDGFDSYPGLLIALIYAALPFASDTADFHALSDCTRRLWSYSVFAVVMQWVVGLLLTLLVLRLFWPDLHTGFGVLLASGFVGGHGTAAAVGAAFSELGWKQAGTLAMTSATVGILGSIAGGIVWIRWGTRTGRTRFISRFDELPEALRTGLLPQDTRSTSGEETVAANVLDPLMFQCAIVLLGFLCGFYLKALWASIFPTFVLPLFSLSFVAALMIRRLLLRTGLLSLVDQRSIRRISGSLTDLLIVFGIASIQFPVIVQYAVPLAILFTVGFVLCGLIVWLFGPLFLGDDWFEGALFTWGWITGVMAMGMALLRIVDSEHRSRVLDSFALAYLFVIPVEVGLITFVPQLMAHDMSWLVFAATALIAALLLSGALWSQRGRRP
jgi:glutamate:Na+ symporter, ESS family